jgi:hypothetical protein
MDSALPVAHSEIRATGTVPGNRSSFSAVLHERRIYVFGGLFSVDGYALWALDTASAQWSRVDQKGTPPSKRSGHSAVMHNGKMYVFGGRRGEAPGSGYLSDVHIFDFGVRRWMKASCTGTAPSARAGHVAAVVEDGLMVIHGGISNGEEIVGDTFGLRLETLEWIPIRSHTSLAPRHSHACCALTRDLLCVYGGQSADGLCDDVWLFDARKLLWTAVENFRLPPQGALFPSARRGHSLSRLGSRCVLLCGGFDEEQGTISDAWVFVLYGSGSGSGGGADGDASGMWVPLRAKAGRTPMPARENHVAMTVDRDRVLLIFGQASENRYENTLWKLELGDVIRKIGVPKSAADENVPRQPTPLSSQPQSHTSSSSTSSPSSSSSAAPGPQASQSGQSSLSPGPQSSHGATTSKSSSSTTTNQSHNPSPARSYRERERAAERERSSTPPPASSTRRPRASSASVSPPASSSPASASPANVNTSGHSSGSSPRSSSSRGSSPGSSSNSPSGTTANNTSSNNNNNNNNTNNNAIGTIVRMIDSLDMSFRNLRSSIVREVQALDRRLQALESVVFAPQLSNPNSPKNRNNTGSSSSNNNYHASSGSSANAPAASSPLAVYPSSMMNEAEEDDATAAMSLSPSDSQKMELFTMETQFSQIRTIVEEHIRKGIPSSEMVLLLLVLRAVYSFGSMGTTSASVLDAMSEFQAYMQAVIAQASLRRYPLCQAVSSIAYSKDEVRQLLSKVSSKAGDKVLQRRAALGDADVSDTASVRSDMSEGNSAVRYVISPRFLDMFDAATS